MLAGFIELMKVDADSPAMRIANRHMLLAVIAWSCYAASLFLRLEGTTLREPGPVALGLSALGFAALCVTGWLGGTLVYEQGSARGKCAAQRRNALMPAVVVTPSPHRLNRVAGGETRGEKSGTRGEKSGNEGEKSGSDAAKSGMHATQSASDGEKSGNDGEKSGDACRSRASSLAKKAARMPLKVAAMVKKAPRMKKKVATLPEKAPRMTPKAATMAKKAACMRVEVPRV